MVDLSNHRADVVVVGGGVAGCAAALSAARRGASVTMLTSLPDPEETNTRYAQGGIIYTGPEDSPALLARDILSAGANAGDPRAARLLAQEGPQLVKRLLIEELEVPFDRDDGGFEGLHLTREGAHSADRIIHRRDTTGSAIQAAMSAAVAEEGRITVVPGARATSLAVERPSGRCAGVYADYEGEGVEIRGRSVVLATGGLGGLYAHTTNPPGATGDGVALAMSARARVRDLHYVQFHPTALYTSGERFLISEAVRGEGGVLRDPDGREFVDHALGSLAPRDVVAREIAAMMERTGSPCAYLDLTSRPREWISRRFPAIFARCLEDGVDPSREPIPVVPAAHYSCGGVATDERGRTSVRGLWAAGEVARTGLHGANRLASTSLLEGLVWGWRSGEDAARPGPAPLGAVRPAKVCSASGVPQEAWERMRAVMWERAGLVRNGPDLERGLRELAALEREYGGTELEAPLSVCRAIVEGALRERSSLGCHYRADAEEEGVADLPG
ncbi:MAG: L-aspartate oxidase [Rubrobacter sp.]|nr:L-aspartate oxidase [Rubrobacter sp.]